MIQPTLSARTAIEKERNMANRTVTIWRLIFVAEVTTPVVERVSATHSRIGQYETAAAVIRREWSVAVRKIAN